MRHTGHGHLKGLRLFTRSRAQDTTGVLGRVGTEVAFEVDDEEFSARVEPTQQCARAASEPFGR